MHEPAHNREAMSMPAGERDGRRAPRRLNRTGRARGARAVHLALSDEHEGRDEGSRL